MRILCVQPRRLGDILLTTPAVRYLRENFPQAQIDFLSDPMGKLVLSGNPHLNNLIFYEKKKPLREIFNVRKRKYDAVLDFMGNPRTALLTALSGAKWRVGFDFRARRFYYNHVIKRPDGPQYGGLTKLRLVQEWSKMAGILPGPFRRVRPEIFPGPDDEKVATDWFDQEGKPEKCVILAPVHRHAIRQWRLEGFREVALSLFNEGAQVYLAWGPGEERWVEQVRSGEENKIKLLPATTFRQMAAIFKKARVIVTNDSGAMHVAVAMDRPTVTIYGPTRPQDWNPSFVDDQQRDVVLQSPDVACLGCHLGSCPVGHLCMQNLSAVTVTQAAKKFLN